MDSQKVIVLNHSSRLCLIIFLSSLFCFGCKKEDYSIRYVFTNLTLENLDNTGELPLPTNSISVPANAYGIRLNLYPVIVSKGDMLIDAYEYPPQNINYIDSIRVTSNNDFNPSHPAGASLNDLFIYFNRSYFSTSTLEAMSIQNNYHEDFYEHPIPDYADLLLISLPDTPSTHVFTVEIHMLDKTVYTNITPPVTLF